MKATKRIALVAHDERKEDLLAWTRLNVATLTRHQFNTIYDQEFKDYSAYIRRPI